jgi:capsular exopolysaccharide synthesis family protein
VPVELDEYVLALRKRWLIIAALALVGAVTGWLYANSMTPNYRATTNVFVSVNGGGTAGELVQGSTFVQNSVESFAKLASMPVVLDPVIEDLQLDTTAKALGRSISANNPLNTVILQISTTGPQPQLAADISNAVARQLAVTVQNLSPRTAAGQSSIELTVVAPAVPPETPFEPNTRFLGVTGLALGLGAGVILALLLTIFDTRVRTAADIERVIHLPALATIVRARQSQQPATTVAHDPSSRRAEGFRRLQANLQYLDVGKRLSSVVVTSAVPGEGKSTTALNLALAVAENGKSVLVIDADLRRPAIALDTGLEAAAGLTTILIGRATLEDVVQPWGEHDGLHVLTSGEIPPNPSQLLDSPAMHRVLDEAVKTYDLVVVDCPPVLPVVDASVLGRHVDGVLLVIGLRQVRRQQVRSALAAITAVGATPLGLVITNAVDDGAGAPYSYRRPDEIRPHRSQPWRRRRPDEIRQNGTDADADASVSSTAGPEDPRTPISPEPREARASAVQNANAAADAPDADVPAGGDGQNRKKNVASPTA